MKKIINVEIVEIAYNYNDHSKCDYTCNYLDTKNSKCTYKHFNCDLFKNDNFFIRCNKCLERTEVKMWTLDEDIDHYKETIRYLQNHWDYCKKELNDRDRFIKNLQDEGKI